MTKHTIEAPKTKAAPPSESPAAASAAPQQGHVTTFVATSSVEAEQERLNKMAPELPKLSDPAKATVDGAKRLSDADLADVMAWLRFESRRRWVESESSRLQPGQRVRILRGKERYLGKEGIALIVRKARAFVQVAGYASPIYVLIADVERVG